MSAAAARAPMPAPGHGTVAAWPRVGAGDHRPVLHLAQDDVAPARHGVEPETDADLESDHAQGPRALLAPRVERPADRLPALAPLAGPPPSLGSPEGRARHAQRAGAVGSTRPAGEPAPPPDAALPDPTQLCCAVVQAAVEGLRGARPLAQLVRWVSPEVYEELTLRAELVLVAGVPTPTGRAGIRRIRVCRIGARAAEATVIVDDGPRVRAVAVRLEAHRGRWRATALQIG